MIEAARHKVDWSRLRKQKPSHQQPQPCKFQKNIHPPWPSTAFSSVPAILQSTSANLFQNQDLVMSRTWLERNCLLSTTSNKRRRIISVQPSSLNRRKPLPALPQMFCCTRQTFWFLCFSTKQCCKLPQTQAENASKNPPAPKVPKRNGLGADRVEWNTIQGHSRGHFRRDFDPTCLQHGLNLGQF